MRVNVSGGRVIVDGTVVTTVEVNLTVSAMVTMAGVRLHALVVKRMAMVKTAMHVVGSVMADQRLASFAGCATTTYTARAAPAVVIAQCRHRECRPPDRKEECGASHDPYIFPTGRCRNSHLIVSGQD